MFTGIVEALGRVVEAARQGRGLRLKLRVPAAVAEDLGEGDSVAVSGVCLTVVERAGERLGFDLSDETLAVTTLGELEVDEPVNVERPLRLGTRLGGHLVLGHVDGTGRITRVAPEALGRRVDIEVPPTLRQLLIPKGSVAVDGVSLTVAAIGAAEFSVALIPHTLEATTLGRRGVGSRVNLEMDVLGKYVRALLSDETEARGILLRQGLVAPGVSSGGGGGDLQGGSG
jgi:riboflavin synthase alpha subunit